MSTTRTRKLLSTSMSSPEVPLFSSGSVSALGSPDSDVTVVKQEAEERDDSRDGDFLDIKPRISKKRGPAPDKRFRVRLALPPAEWTDDEDALAQMSSEVFRDFVIQHTGKDSCRMYAAANSLTPLEHKIKRVYRRIKNRESAQKSRNERLATLAAATSHDTRIKQLTERVDTLERQLEGSRETAERLKTLESAFSSFMERYEAEHRPQQDTPVVATCTTSCCCHEDIPDSTVSHPLESIFGH